MQRGQLFSVSGSWYLRFYDATGRRVCRRLGRVSSYPSRESIEPLAQELIGTIHRYCAKSLGRFVEKVYLPDVQREQLLPGLCLSFATLAGLEDKVSPVANL